MLCLNKANKIVGFYNVSNGGRSSTIVDPKIIFTVSLKCASSSIIIAHNHPSGSLIPSSQDKTITRKIKEGGDILEIKLLDHLIVSSKGYYSFAEGTSLLD